MEAHWVAMQQQQEDDAQNHDPFAYDNLEEVQPAMEQEGMEWNEDSLTSSSTSSLASEVTFTDLQRELDEEITSQEGKSSNLANFQLVHNMLDFLYIPPYLVMNIQLQIMCHPHHSINFLKLNKITGIIGTQWRSISMKTTMCQLLKE